MKRILVIIAVVFAFSGIYAQEDKIQSDMAFYTKTLNLETVQRADLSKVIIRKHGSLENIESLKNSDEKLYREKRRNIYTGTEASIKRILKQEQLSEWQAYKAKQRRANAENYKSLKAKNADKQDLLDAQIGIIN